MASKTVVNFNFDIKTVGAKPKKMPRCRSPVENEKVENFSPIKLSKPYDLCPCHNKYKIYCSKSGMSDLLKYLPNKPKADDIIELFELDKVKDQKDIISFISYVIIEQNPYFYEEEKDDEEIFEENFNECVCCGLDVEECVCVDSEEDE